MADRATSLLGTALHPLRAFLPILRGMSQAGRVRDRSVPAVNLKGVILARQSRGSSAEATAIYGGTYRFAGQSVSATPSKIFKLAVPADAWRREFLRLDWLEHFRTSQKMVHGLFALKLIAEWQNVKPAYKYPSDLFAALFNLSVAGPELAVAQSSAALVVVNNAISYGTQRVLQARAATPAEALAKAMALLAAHLVTKDTDTQRQRLLRDISEILPQIVTADGSHISGDSGHFLTILHDLMALLGGLERSGDTVPQEMMDSAARMIAYHEMMDRGDGSFAFTNDAPHSTPMLPAGLLGHRQQLLRLAGYAGHARLDGNEARVFAQFRQAGGLQMEMLHGKTPILWIDEVPGLAAGATWQPQLASLLVSAKGTLLTVPSAAASAGTRKTSIFLSADGEDLRVEDDRPAGNGGHGLLFQVPEDARISTTHNGAGALIVFDRESSWQLVVRGATLAVDKTGLRLIPDCPGNGLVNWALKRLVRPKKPAATRKKEPPPALL